MRIIIALALAFALIPACVCSESEKPKTQEPSKKERPKERVEILRDKGIVRPPLTPPVIPADARPTQQP